VETAVGSLRSGLRQCGVGIRRVRVVRAEDFRRIHGRLTIPGRLEGRPP